MQLSGAEIMCRILAEEGVTTVFGYPGGAILPFYDALRQSPIQHILTAHEQGAAHAADGFARASGKVGVCIATSGPGATNLVTGLATAFLDSVPVVAITGQVNRELIGHDAFQEVDITGITMPITKHNFLVKKPENLAQTLRLAFQLAREGRPGPVLVDVPRDVQTALIDFEEVRLAELQPLEPDAERVAAAAAAINKSKRPVMLVGGGVINANAEYDAMHLCEKLHIPVVSTLMGLGAISAYRQLFLGMTGLHGHERANNAVKEADLILAVGSRFNDRVTGERSRYSANKLIIHLDIDPAEVDKNIDSGIGITGDMVATLNALEKAAQPHDLGAWWDKINSWPGMDDDFGDEEAPKFFKALNPVLKDKDYIITTDVGQHQMWAAQHLKIQFARQWLTSGGLGTMGFGLPAALGAQLARPQSRVISISGDGGFKMTGSELFTIASNNVPVIAIVFNNSGLGMIRQLQTVQFAKRFTACELPGYVDFVKYAAAFGIEGEHADTPDALAQAVAKAWERRKPYLIEVCVNPKNMVLPMVAPGLGINDFVKFANDEIN
ncbi:biosynthetic-type acetolactate synthase large subunit [uncultured Phascolarctobacterium sp.]|uniref:biosynthetic-type acetolactate synthase large subunit n=1 Tax=uncultured Phascolarctobacterium sp. TaxID=512296 RepID=UPI0025DDAA39|nr:biosynthetic-type acetolactate synthase large subunit [uncultured Phascolarctobacterium sp.]